MEPSTTTTKATDITMLKISFGLSIIFCCIGAYLIYFSQHLPAGYGQATGTEIGTMMDSYGRRALLREFYVVRFTTEKGEVVEVKSHVPIPSYSSPHLGNKIVVYYDKNNPRFTRFPVEDTTTAGLAIMLGLLFLFKPVKYFLRTLHEKK